MLNALVDVFTLSATPLALAGAGALGALAAGFGGSAHCALMCGPLACAGVPADPRPAVRRRARLAWHVGRVGGYVAVGGALGLVGEAAQRLLTSALAPVLPWIMAAGLFATALQLGRRLPAIPGLATAARAVARTGARFSPAVRAGAMGAATPLLPCGLLYGVFLAALASGRLWGGAVILGAFALGGTPALAAVQLHAPLLARHPRAVAVLRRAVPAVAACVLVWRALHAGAGAAPHCH